MAEQLENFNMIRTLTEATMIKISERFGACLKNNRINTDIIFCPDETALRWRAEKDGRSLTTNAEDKIEYSDKYVLEFLNIWVTDMVFSWERQRTSAARSGIGTEFKSLSTGSKEFWMMHKAVPVDITFTVSFWTRYKERMDKFVQEFMFWQQERPMIELFYDNDKKLEFFVSIGTHVIHDDLSIKNMFKEGKYWKHTFDFVVEAWVIKGIPIRTAKKIVLDMYISDDLQTKEEENKFFSETMEDAGYLNIACVAGDLNALDVNEIAVRDYLLNLGHTVTLIDTLSLAIVNTYDLTIFSFASLGEDLSAVKATAKGLLFLYANDSVGFGNTVATLSTQYLNVYNNQHYLTEGLALGESHVHTATPTDMSSFSIYRNGEQRLGSVLGICDIDKLLGDGTKATGRRVLYGNWQFSSATSQGKDMLRKAVQWAGSKEYAEVGV